MAEDEEKECARYNALLEQLPRDIQLLGLGSNGHIAFNEPGTPFSSGTHVVTLAESTVKDNARLFDDISEVPRNVALITDTIAAFCNIAMIDVPTFGAELFAVLVAVFHYSASSKSSI